MKATEKQFWDEIQKASNRIGLSAEKATEWLLNFAQIDLAVLSEGQWLDLRGELEVFFACGPPKSDHDMADRHFFTHPNKEGTWSPFIQRKGIVPEVQKIIKKALKDLVESGVKIISWGFRLLVMFTMGIPSKLTDTQCGFKMYNGEIARKLYKDCITNGFMFDIEIILRALQQGYEIKEFAIEWAFDLDSRLPKSFTLREMFVELREIKKALS